MIYGKLLTTRRGAGIIVKFYNGKNNQYLYLTQNQYNDCRVWIFSSGIARIDPDVLLKS